MRVVRWRKADTGVESFTITATGVYFPVGKTDSSFKLKLSMAAGGQTAAVDTVRDVTGTRTGYGAMNVSGTTETKLGAVVSLATGIIVTAISGTLTPILDDEIAITTWPEWGIGRFPAKEDADAYVYGSNPPLGLTATLPSGPVTWRGAGAGRWVGDGIVYNGTTLPIPTVYSGDYVLVANPNVPSGKTSLCWTGTAYKPCAGDVILELSGDPYLTQATPGVQALYKAWESPVIPDYLIPDKTILRLNVSANIRNISGVGGCHIMSSVSGSEPSDIEAVNYALGIRSFTPSASGSGFAATVAGYQRRSGSVYKKPSWGMNSANILTTSESAAEITANSVAMEFIPGSSKMYVKAVTKSVNDIVTVNFAQVSVGM